MCTVTYLPLPNEGFILTSNRDEKTVRKKALPPRKFAMNGTSVFFPQDQEAGGTWIATSNNSVTLCLLNGAKSKHTSNPPYRLSRGQVVLDYFSFPTVEKFANTYDFHGIEPFTLIIVENLEQVKLHQLRWDGQKVELQNIDNRTAQIWSSSTLYTEQTITQRNAIFQNWINERKEFRNEDVLELHQFGSVGEEGNNFVMNRNNEVKTVSITSIIRSTGEVKLTYNDLLENKVHTIRIM